MSDVIRCRAQEAASEEAAEIVRVPEGVGVGGIKDSRWQSSDAVGVCEGMHVLLGGCEVGSIVRAGRGRDGRAAAGPGVRRRLRRRAALRPWLSLCSRRRAGDRCGRRR